MPKSKEKPIWSLRSGAKRRETKRQRDKDMVPSEKWCLDGVGDTDMVPLIWCHDLVPKEKNSLKGDKDMVPYENWCLAIVKSQGDTDLVPSCIWCLK